MKKSTIISGIAMGLGVVGLAAAGVALHTVGDFKRELYGINNGFKSLKDKVDISVPENVAQELVKDAAESVAKDTITKTTADVMKKANNDISSSVRKAVNDASNGLSDKIEKEMSKQINLLTIDDIKDSVAERVADLVYNDYNYQVNGGSNHVSKEDIIKECIAKGKTSYEIQQIMKALE